MKINIKGCINGVLIVIGVAIAITLIIYSIFWFYVIINRQPLSQIPSPPQKPVSIVGIEIGVGFHAAEPIVMVYGGKEYKYLGSSTESLWEPVEEISFIRNDVCESRIINKFEKQIGEITQCMKANTFGEWCPSPDYYFVLSSNGDIWKYKKDYPCSTINVPLSFLSGVFLGIIIAIVYLIRKRSNRKIADMPNPRST